MSDKEEGAISDSAIGGSDGSGLNVEDDKVCRFI